MKKIILSNPIPLLCISLIFSAEPRVVTSTRISQPKLTSSSAGGARFFRQQVLCIPSLHSQNERLSENAKYFHEIKSNVLVFLVQSCSKMNDLSNDAQF